MKHILLLLLSGMFVINTTSQVADNYLLKAGILAEKKNYNEAYQAINQSSSKNNKHYPIIFAQIKYGIKNYSEAENLYSTLELENPGNYQLELSRCAAMEGNMPKAMEHLELYFKSKNKLPISKIVNEEAFSKFRGNAVWENMWQKIDYSEAELKLNQIRSAAENSDNQYLSTVLDEALRKYPNNPELLYHQSKLFYDRKVYGAAEKSINEAIGKSGSDRYYFQKSLIEQKNNKYKDALVSINEAIKKNPFNPGYYVSRIEINKNLGNSTEVNSDIKLLSFCLPDDPAVLLATIKIEADKGNLLNAIDGLNSLIEKDSNNEEYYVLRGKLNLKTQKLQNADEDFGMALDLNPSDAEANLGKGLAKYKLEDSSAACYYWQKASNEGSREALEYINKFCGK